MQNTNTSFPYRLFQLLEYADESTDVQAIISWQPHGRSFLIKDKKRLQNEVLPLFFSTVQYDSFRRNLNHWGFLQIRGPKSPDCKSYYHKFFLRNRKDLCSKLKRQKRGTNVSNGDSLCPLLEPKFHEMEWLPKTIQKEEKPAASFDGNKQTRLFMPPMYDPFVPSHSDPGRIGVGSNLTTDFSANGTFVATDAGSSSSISTSSIKNIISATPAKQKTHGSIIRTTAMTDEREVITFDHTKKVTEDASFLLENFDNIVWDENLWQREFLKQQQSLLPDDLSKLNSVFD